MGEGRPGSAVFIALALFAGNAVGDPAPAVPAARIAAGAPLQVDSNSDPASALINARVDIGRLRQVGDAIEAELAWTLRSGMLNDARAGRPGVVIPEGSASISRERIVCGAEGALSYSVETRIVAADGKLLDRQARDAAAQRKKAEAQERSLARMTGRPTGYGPDPRSLVCWAAACRCEGRAFTWPPPPNLTPLEHSARADEMRQAYAARFVPNCRLPA